MKGAHNQAKRRGEAQLKAFQAIKKRGGKEFIARIMGFQSECAGCGRGWSRPAFDFAAYEMALVTASRVQRGAKSLWMNQQAYCTWWLGQNADEIMATAILDFHHQLESLSAGKVSEDKKEIPMMVEQILLPFRRTRMRSD